MNTLYLQMETETLLNKAPLTRSSCRMIKRTFDIITALIVLILIFPWAYLIIACCIKIFMPGPIFFKQKRTGMELFLHVTNSEQWMLKIILTNL